VTASTHRIDSRFRGPPNSGNGGYVCGLLARELGGSDCTVTLRQPPPLDENLRLDRADGAVSLLHGEQLIASAVRAELVHQVPAPPSYDAAVEAESRFTGLRHHIFPGCFVCGPERGVGDGLRIFPGGVDDAGSRQVAAGWIPDASLGDDSGQVRSEFVWAALDCPGYFGLEDRAGLALLGRLGATIYRPLEVGEPVIVTGWAIESSGRKHLAGSALHDRSGALLAAGTATWITLEAPLS
jgi:hypothetical protein